MALNFKGFYHENGPWWCQESGQANSTISGVLSLEPAVWQMVEPGSIVRTDAWRGYNGLSELGYQHNIVRKDPDLGDNLLPLANRVASLLKRWLLGTHQGAVQHSHLDYYLDEFTFRFNRRTSKSRGLLFYRLVSQAVDLGPVLETQLRVPSDSL